MGVNLTGLTEPKNIELADLKGRTVAIDAYNTIYQFLSIIRQPDGSPLTDSQGRVTSHLSGLLYRTANLIESGISPSFVFDGIPHELKTGTIMERRARREKAEKEWEDAVEEGDIKKAFSKAQQTSRMTPEIKETSRSLLEFLGIPVVNAPSDGEAQAAYMNRKGDVWASASQDFDSILYGAPTLVRNMTITGRRKIPGRDQYRDVKIELIDCDAFLKEIGTTREQLVDVCILMGTDFNPGIGGIGPKKGLKLIRTHGDLEGVMRHLGEEIDNYEEIRNIFLRSTYSDDHDLTVKKIDTEKVCELMCEQHDFSKERVLAVIDRIENSRKAEEARKKQRSLFDSWG
ncbi:MAG: flap endonuclease-1 [Methanomassiliicoccaceae archaeon]|jgi:flap endonuclease-1|nr:flap endonuclease-1 [Methanomassiliicoccaceae archaeon]